jgi:hypothetical protein
MRQTVNRAMVSRCRCPGHRQHAVVDVTMWRVDGLEASNLHLMSMVDVRLA